MCGDDCWLHKPVKPPMFDLYGLVDLWQNLNRKQNGRYPQMSWICLYFPPIREVVDGSWKMNQDNQSICSYVGNLQPWRSGNSSPSMVEAVRLTSASRCDLASADSVNPWLHPKWGLPLATKTHGWSSISCQIPNVYQISLHTSLSDGLIPNLPLENFTALLKRMTWRWDDDSENRNKAHC